MNAQWIALRVSNQMTLELTPELAKPVKPVDM
jgi:hypothetical protein